MARLDRRWLEQAAFPSVQCIPTRYADLDEQRHVNNSAAVSLLQEGRVRFNQELDLRDGLGGLRLMVAGLTIEYAAELGHPEAVDVHSGITRIGRSSFTVAQVVRQSGRAAIFAETTMVVADADGPVAIPTHLRSTFASVLMEHTRIT